MATKEESISFIAECLNNAHKETSAVITVIENMARLFHLIACVSFETPIFFVGGRGERNWFKVHRNREYH